MYVVDIHSTHFSEVILINTHKWQHMLLWRNVCLFVLRLNVPVNNFSVMSGRIWRNEEVLYLSSNTRSVSLCWLHLSGCDRTFCFKSSLLSCAQCSDLTEEYADHSASWCFRFEPPHEKTNKMSFAPSNDSDQPGSESLLSAWRKAGSLATHWVYSETLVRLGGCPGRLESSLGAHSILLVLSWRGSFTVRSVDC